MVIDELLEYMSPENWVWVADSHRQVFYGMAKHMPVPVRDLEVGTVSGDMNYAGTIDIYVKEER